MTDTEIPARNCGASRGWNLASNALIFCVTCLAYWPALHGRFLWDDDGHVTAAGLSSLAGLGRIWAELGATQQYYPLLHSAFWLEHRLWENAPFGYHLTNVLLHAAAACLVVAIMRRLALPGALLAGLLFALHPVAVESVAWISEQKNTLSAVFALGSLLVYLRFDDDRRRSCYCLALGLFALALLTKTVTATLPAALLVVLWWRRGRLSGKRDLLPLLPWFILGIGAGLFSAWMERTFIGAQGPEFALTLAQRALLAGRAVWFYPAKLLWPADLMFIYPRWELNPAIGWPYLFPIGVLAALAVLGVVARRQRGPLAGFLIYLAMLFPVLGFFNVYPFVFSYVADHFQYLACLGIIAPVAAGLTFAVKRIPVVIAVPGLAPLLGAALLAGLAGLTWRQSGLYRDGETLYRATLARNPAAWLAHNNLGNILAQDPARRPEAVAEYEAALRLKPDLADAHFNLANALAKTSGRLPEAIAHYEAALQIEPLHAAAHNNLGTALVKTAARLPEAIIQFEKALQIDPALAEAHCNLGTALAKIPGRLPDAIIHYRTALRLMPGNVDAHFNLANALALTPEHQPEAIAEYEAALRLAPDFAEGHYNLAVLLAKFPGHRQEEIAHYEAALRLRPGWESVTQILQRLRAAQDKP